MSINKLYNSVAQFKNPITDKVRKIKLDNLLKTNVMALSFTDQISTTAITNCRKL
jgi:hypothetical protein